MTKSCRCWSCLQSCQQLQCVALEGEGPIGHVGGGRAEQWAYSSHSFSPLTGIFCIIASVTSCLSLFANCSKALSCNSALPFWPAWHILKYFPHSTCLSCLLACEDLRPVCAKHSGEAVVQLPLEWHRRRAEGRCWHYLHLIILLGLYLLAIPSSRYNLLLASV